MNRVCFVCSGNICRSPTAEVVLRALVGDAGDVEVDSAGTGGWHAGDDMDARSRSTLVAAGYHPGGHVAKQFTLALFDEREVIVALDSGHLDMLRDAAELTADPAAARAKLVLLREHDPLADDTDRDVSDPYYGGASGFTDVLGQIERSCTALLAELRAGQTPAG